MRPVATDVARSVVCVSVCLCAGHSGELYKNGWIARDPVLGLMRVQEIMYEMGTDMYSSALRAAQAHCPRHQTNNTQRTHT